MAQSDKDMQSTEFIDMFISICKHIYIYIQTYGIDPLRLSCHSGPPGHPLGQVGERPQWLVPFSRQFWPFGWSQTTEMASKCRCRGWSEIICRASAGHGTSASYGFDYCSVFYLPVHFPLWSIPCASFSPGTFSEPPCTQKHRIHHGSPVVVACYVLSCAICSACDCLFTWPGLDWPKIFKIEIVPDLVRTPLWNSRKAVWSQSSCLASLDCATSSIG